MDGICAIYKEQLQNKREPWDKNIFALHAVDKNKENLQIENFKGKIL